MFFHICWRQLGNPTVYEQKSPEQQNYLTVFRYHTHIWHIFSETIKFDCFLYVCVWEEDIIPSSTAERLYRPSNQFQFLMSLQYNFISSLFLGITFSSLHSTSKIGILLLPSTMIN